MKPFALLVALAALPSLLALPAAALAQDKAKEQAAQVPAKTASAPARTVVRLPDKPSDVQERGEANVKYTIIEDDSAHIEELRVRGTTQRIVVTPKIGPKIGNGGYEIIMGDGSRDLSPGANTSRGAAGQRVWHVLSF